jgi:hypothetical protein
MALEKDRSLRMEALYDPEFKKVWENLRAFRKLKI